MNLVISTTFGWNIGDQFILAGVKNLLTKAWGQFQVVYHDRNPNKQPFGGTESHQALNCGWADALIIAGSPGWTLECDELYRTALDYNVPIYMIGIGTGCGKDYLSEQISSHWNVLEAIDSAKLIICRDEIARDVIKAQNCDVELLPCPVTMIQHNSYPHGYPSGVLTAMGENYESYRTAMTDVGLVAHQMWDLKRSGGRAFYSECAEDYYSKYANCKAVVSSRLHASVLCKVLGTPVTNLWPDDDPRCGGTWAVVEQGFQDGIGVALDKYLGLLSKVKPVRK